MCKHIRQLIEPTAYEDDERKRVAALLYPVSLSVMLVGILACAAALYLGDVAAGGALAVTILGAFGSRLLARRGQLRGATLLLLLVILGVLDFLVYYSDGIHDIALIAYPALIIVSGLLLDRRAFIVHMVLIVLSLLTMGIFEISGLIVNRFSEYTSHGDLVYLFIILFPTAALARQLSKSIAGNLDKIHSSKLALDKKNRELQDALDKITVLDGLLPICAYCKKIRDDKGDWQQVEVYIHTHSDVDFSHSVCPECYQKELDAMGCHGSKTSDAS